MKLIDKDVLLKTFKAYRDAIAMWRTDENREAVDGMLNVADQMIRMTGEQVEYERRV